MLPQTFQVKNFFDRKTNLPVFALSFLFFVAFLAGPTKSIGQELRVYGGIQAFGEIEGAFSGGGIGIESRLGRHLTLNADVNAGFQELGNAIELKPSLLFYFKKEKTGFYFGPSFKYIALNEKGGTDKYDDSLYAFGFSFGLKGRLSENTFLLVNLSPHKTIGGNNEADVAGLSAQIGLSFRL